MGKLQTKSAVLTRQDIEPATDAIVPHLLGVSGNNEGTFSLLITAIAVGRNGESMTTEAGFLVALDPSPPTTVDQLFQRSFYFANRRELNDLLARLDDSRIIRGKPQSHIPHAPAYLVTYPGELPEETNAMPPRPPRLSVGKFYAELSRLAGQRSGEAGLLFVPASFNEPMHVMIQKALFFRNERELELLLRSFLLHDQSVTITYPVHNESAAVGAGANAPIDVLTAFAPEGEVDRWLQTHDRSSGIE